MTETARRTRRHEQGDRSREEILDAAAALMSAKGYSGTSISDLARESKLTPSSIYWHFESKAGVLTAVMERGARRFFDANSAVPPLASTTPAERLTRLMDHSILASRQHPEFLRLFMLLLLGSEGGAAQDAVVDRVREEGHRLLHATLLLAYQPWGLDLAQRVADALVDLLFALIDGVFIAGQTRRPPHLDTLVPQMAAAVHNQAVILRAGSGD